MHIIKARNVNDAFPQAIQMLAGAGSPQESGFTRLEVSGPVSVCYGNPTQRVMLWPEADFNPFTNFLVGLWYLSGDNSRMWLTACGISPKVGYPYGISPEVVQILLQQLQEHETVYTSDPECQLIFKRNSRGAIDLFIFTVNELLLRKGPSHTTGMSFLQEYVAEALGLLVGRLWIVASGMQMKTDFLEEVSGPVLDRYDPIAMDCNYEAGDVEPFRLMSASGVQKTFDQDLSIFMEDQTAVGFRHAFFRKVATPMFTAWRAFQEEKGEDRVNIALEIVDQMPAQNDWRAAAEGWLHSQRYIDV